ncbi:MAG: uroporphyrinogen decarboxylase [Acidobacteriota bacterium]
MVSPPEVAGHSPGGLSESAVNDPLIVRALKRQPTPRRPVWIMRQAGRYLPEYRRLKEQHSFLELATDPRRAAEVTLLPFERFSLDGAVIFADIMSPMAALGIEVQFAPGPVIEQPLRSAADVDRLPRPASAEVAPEVVEALRLVRDQLPPDVATIGFAGAPLTLAAYLIQGHGKSDFPRLRAFAASDPRGFSRLLGRLAQVVAGFLRRQIEVGGAQTVQVFESWAGLLSAADWRALVRPHLFELLQEVGRSAAPRILFMNHAGPVLDGLLTENAWPFEALAVDWRQDLGSLAQRLDGRCALQGNLDPAILLTDPDTIVTQTRRLLHSVPPLGHVVNLGHGIQPDTPLEHVEAFLRSVRTESGSTLTSDAESTHAH